MLEGYVKADLLETYKDVGRRFGISERRVAQLVRETGLPTHKDQLDKRKKLLGQEHVEAISHQLRISPVEDNAPAQGGVLAKVDHLSALIADQDKRIQGMYETIASINQTNAFLLQRLVAVEQQIHDFVAPARVGR
jgi:hypothetical protein